MISTASGNINATGTWSVVDATSLLNSESGSTALNAANGTSSAFTPGAITVSGIAVKLATNTNSTGTVKIELVVAGTSVPGTAVTLNCADLVTATAATAEGGWVVTDFANTLLVAATVYNVKITTASGCNQTFWTDGTASNWSRMLITTATQAGGPAAGDSFLVYGQLTGAGTHNSFTVTMNTTANINYGNVANTLISPSIAVGQFGTLAFGTAAATNYLMEAAGPMVEYNGGTFTIGATGTPVPVDSTAVFTLNTTVEGDTGLTVRNGATFNVAGVPRTTGKNAVQTHLSANIAAGAQTSLAVLDDTGWLSGDVIVLATTDVQTNASHSEKLTLSSNATSAALPISATLSFSHLGQVISYTSTNNGVSYSFPEQAEIILLTRNVKIQGSANATPGYIFCGQTATCAMTWVEFNFISGKAAAQFGLQSETISTGAFSLTNFSFHDALHAGVIMGGTQTNTIWGGTVASPATIQNGGFYNVCQANLSSPSNNDFGILSFTTNNNWVFDNLTFLGVPVGNCSTVLMRAIGGQFTNIVIADNIGTNATVMQLTTPTFKTMGSWGPLTFHSNSSVAVDLNLSGNGTTGTINGLYTYHSPGSFSSGANVRLTINPIYTLGGLNWGGFGLTGSTNLTLQNGFLAFDTTAKPPILIDETISLIEMDNVEACPTQTVTITQSTGATSGNSVFLPCNTGNISSIQPVADVGNGGAYTTLRVIARNSPLLAAIDVSLPGLLGQSFMSPDSYVSADWIGTHKSFLTYGILTQDNSTNCPTCVRNGETYSTRLAPQIVRFTGAIAGTTLTATGTVYPAVSIANNLVLTGVGTPLATGTIVQGYGSGTGGTGTYTVNNSQTISAETMTGPQGRLQSAPLGQGVKVAVASGGTATVCVWARESLNTDSGGITYNGDAPRLINRTNPSIGVNSDAILATYSGSGWQQLCGTSAAANSDGEFEFVVDADMTATSNAGGWVNVTDWTSSGGAVNPNGSQQFWFNGVPFNSSVPTGGSSGGGTSGGAGIGSGAAIGAGGRMPIGP